MSQQTTKSPGRITLWVCVLLATCSGYAGAASRADFEQALEERTGASAAVNSKLLDGILALYEELDYQLIWSDHGLLTQLRQGIESSYDDGLNPRDYPLPPPAQGNVLAGIQYDIGNTKAFLTLLNHLYYGKVSPVSLDSDWNIEDLRQLDKDRKLIVDAIRAGNVRALFQTARPEQAIYGGLKAGLASYRKIQAAGGWPDVQLPGLLKPGQSDPAVPVLRQRLAITGDTSASAPITEPTAYDPELVTAVKRFQARHLLDTDGVVGPATLTALNRAPQDKIDQIRTNLERMRWFLKGLGDDFLLVDIAGYELYLVQDDTITWSSPIQVGKPFRQTPVLKSNIAYLEWNPTWTVPPTILNEDVLPAIKQDRGYLERKHMVVLTFQGEPVDPQTIDWQQYPGRSFPYLIRQLAGPWNALGTVKFIFPNDHLVYLHDTPSKNLFKASSRAFSSGCIRVGKPYELAKILLNEPGPAGDKHIRGILDSGETHRQFLEPAFPVTLLYWTTKVLEGGALAFDPDIYERDSRVLSALDSQ